MMIMLLHFIFMKNEYIFKLIKKINTYIIYLFMATEPKLLFGTTSSQIYKDETTNSMIITNNTNSANKTDVLIVTESERVGIKNVSPSYDLDVNGDINATNNIKINGNNVISENSLGIGVTSSNLKELGVLNNLTITGNLNTTTITVLDNAQFNKDVNIDGNLNVNGTTTTSNTIQTTVNQNLIELTNNNTANTLDSGFYSLYVDNSTNKYKGLFNDASDNDKFKFFKNIETEPTTTVDTTDNTYELGELEIEKLYTNELDVTSIQSLNVSSNNLYTNNGDVKMDLTVTGDINFHKKLYTSNNKIGINTTTPTHLLDISGVVNAKEYKLDGLTIFTNNSLATGITDSNLETLGNLKDVTVVGNAYLQSTTYMETARVANDLRILGNLGIQAVPNANYRINSNGDINTSSLYRVNGQNVLNQTTLGDSVVNSKLKNFGIIEEINVTTGGNIKIGLQNLTNNDNSIDISGGNINLDNESKYKIGNEDILTKNTLGLSVTSSNLKEFGVIETLNISGNAVINDLEITDKITYGTDFKKNSLNVTESIGIYNTVDETTLDFVFNKTEFNSGIQGQVLSSINFKTDVGGFISENNPDNTLTEYASIKVINNNNMNESNIGTDFVFNNSELNTFNTREVVRIKNTGDVNILNNYQINDNDVITSNSIGTGVTSSNLKQLGVLNNININNKLSVSNHINITDDIYVTGTFYNPDNSRYEFSNLSINISGDIYNLSNNFILGATESSDSYKVFHIEEGNIMLGTTIDNNYTKGIIKFNKHGEHDAIYFGEELNGGTKISIDEGGSCVNIKNGGSGFVGTAREINNRSGQFKVSNYNSTSAEYEPKLYMNTTGHIGINTVNPLTSLHITGTDGLVIPVGNINERVDVTGTIRYNEETQQFEGYSGTWGSLGGVKDVDQDTYISAENNAGDDNDDLKFFTAGIERMIIDNSGNIGIGTTSSNGKLEILGEYGSVSLTEYSYTEMVTDGINLGNAATNSYSIYASGKIAASEFNAVSDKRVKQNILLRDINKDIEIIKKLNVYDYDYIDKLEYGNNNKIGFIAQEVEELNKNFINESKRYIPNIFNNFSLENKSTIISDEKLHLEIGDKIKVQIFDKKYNQFRTYETEIISIMNNKYEINNSYETDINKGIFIYGKLISDFKTIDTNQLLSLNTNVIKYLYEDVIRKDKEIENIKERLKNLENKI